MIYGYARCSTNDTKQDVDRQIRELREKYGAEEVFHEYETGTQKYREEFNKLLTLLEEGDTVAVTEVSRITRSLKQLCEVLEFAKIKKLRMVFGNFVVDCRGEVDHMTEAMLQMMGVFSQLERNMTVERIKSGLAHAKAKGVRLGRRRKKYEELPQRVVELWPLYSGGSLSVTDYAKQCDVSRPTIYRYAELLLEHEYNTPEEQQTVTEPLQ